MHQYIPKVNNLKLTIPIDIDIFPRVEEYGERATEVAHSITQKDLQDELARYFIDNYEDGRQPIGVEVIDREIEFIAKSIVWNLLKRKAHERYPYKPGLHSYRYTNSEGKSEKRFAQTPKKSYAEGVGNTKMKKLGVYARVVLRHPNYDEEEDERQ